MLRALHTGSRGRFTMLHAKRIATLFTATVYFGMQAALAAQPVAPPTELEFAARCKSKPAERFASDAIIIPPRLLPDSPPPKPPYPAKYRQRRIVINIRMLALVNEQG